MKEFLIHVERIVRPIQALDDRKDRMREELLAHLESAFEEERARQDDETLARNRAIASLGDPAQLRNELQDSVSRRELLFARLEKLTCWRAPEPAWRYTLRVGLWTGGIYAALLPIAILMLLPMGIEPVLAALRMIAFMGLLTSFNVFALGFFYFKIRDSLLGAFGVKRSWLRVAGFILASVITVEATLLIFLWCATGEIGENRVLLLSRSAVAFVLPLTGTFVAWIRGPAELRHTAWECLDIGENTTTYAVI